MKNSFSASELLPRDDLARSILKERADYYAKLSSNLTSTKKQNKFIHFMLDNEHYGITYHSSQEVIDNFILTKLSCSHDNIAGVINRRGSLLTIIDIKNFLINKKSDTTQVKSIIVIEAANMTVGVLADKIEGSNEYSNKNLSATMPYEGVINQKYMLGLYKGNIAILNMDTILLEIQAQVNGN